MWNKHPPGSSRLAWERSEHCLSGERCVAFFCNLEECPGIFFFFSQWLSDVFGNVKSTKENTCSGLFEVKTWRRLMGSNANSGSWGNLIHFTFCCHQIHSHPPLARAWDGDVGSQRPRRELMKTAKHRLDCGLLLALLYACSFSESCSSEAARNRALSRALKTYIVGSGGPDARFLVCPKSRGQVFTWVARAKQVVATRGEGTSEWSLEAEEAAGVAHPPQTWFLVRQETRHAGQSAPGFLNQHRESSLLPVSEYLHPWLPGKQATPLPLSGNQLLELKSLGSHLPSQRPWPRYFNSLWLFGWGTLPWINLNTFFTPQTWKVFWRLPKDVLYYAPSSE